MSSRKKIPPATRQARGYAPDDPRYERNSRLQKLEKAVVAPAAATPAPSTPSEVVVTGDGEIAVQVGGVTVGTGDTIDFVAGSNVTIAGSPVAALGKVIVTIGATGGGAGAWDFDEGDASIVYVLGDFDFDGGGA